MIEWINTYSNLIQIVIGILSLFATITVSFLIYWLQKQHECEVRKIEEKIRKKDLEEEAHKFLIDNEEERAYLPLCVFASNLYRHEKHTRKIYTNFCRCSLELQNEILRVAQFNIRMIGNTEWLSKSIQALRSDIKKYELSESNFLYEDAKYFQDAFMKYREIKWKNTPRAFDQIDNRKASDYYNFTGHNYKLTISEYIGEYLDYITEHQGDYEKPLPPFDYVWQSQDLYTADEETVCGWMIELVLKTTVRIYYRRVEDVAQNVFIADNTSAQAETFEDRYLEALRYLYYTYGKYIDTNENISKQKKHNKNG